MSPLRRFSPAILLLIAATAVAACAPQGIRPYLAEAPPLSDDTEADDEAAGRAILYLNTRGHTDIVRELVFTADGQRLVSASDDKTVRVWRLSADGRRLEPERVIRGQIGAGRSGQIHAAALSPPNDAGRQRWLAVAGFLTGSAAERFAVRIHDFESGRVVALLPGHEDAVNSVAFSPDGRWLASGSKDGTVRLWDLASLQEDRKRTAAAPLVLRDHEAAVYDLAWSPTGHRLASASYDRSVGLWDTEPLVLGESPRIVGRLGGHDAGVHTVAFHPRGETLASGGLDETIRLWRASDGAGGGLFAQARHRVAALSFSPDGAWLLAGREGGSLGKQITLFSYPGGAEAYLFPGHENIVLATAFHPRGRWVASGGGNNKEILIWDARTHEVLSRAEGLGRTVWAAGFVDDRTIAWGQTLAARDVNDLGPFEQFFDLRRMDVPFDRPSAPPRGAVTAAGGRSLDVEIGGPYGYPYRLRIHGTGVVVDRGDGSGYRHNAFTFTPDGRHVLSGGMHGTLMLYDAATGEARLRLVGHSGEIKAVAVSPDGRWALSAGTDQTVKLWPINDPPAGADIEPALSLFSTTDGEWVAWTPGGYFAASVGGDRYVGWHVNKGVEEQAEYLDFSQLGRLDRRDVIVEYLALRDIELAVTEANRKRGAGDAPEPVFNAPEEIPKRLPPSILIEAPPDRVAELEGPNLAIRATVQSEALPIARVVVALNGARLTEKRPRRNRFRVDLDVPLAQRENRLAITAYNEDGFSSAEVRTIRCDACAPPRKPDLYLVAIGVSGYDDRALRLAYARDDAAAVAKVFQAEGGVFRRVRPRLLVDEEATKPAIERALAWLQEQGTEQDYGALFLSGHGGLDVFGNYYFFPREHAASDASGPRADAAQDVRWSAMIEALAQPRRPGILIVDTCQTAAAPGSLNFTDVLRAAAQRGNVLVLSAASSGKKAFEPEQLGHGYFTKALLEGLEGSADDRSDARGRGVISSEELGDWVKRRVVEMSDARQRPYHNAGELPSMDLFALSQPSR